MEPTGAFETIGVHSFFQPAEDPVKLVGGPLDGLLVVAKRSSGFIAADMPRQAPALGVAGRCRVMYVRTGPQRFQHQSTNIVTGD